MNDLLVSLDECIICNFADDNTLSVCDKLIKSIVTKLETGLHTALNWFKCNSMAANPTKFQLFYKFMRKLLNSYKLENTKFLEVTLDDKLCFLPHVKNSCRTANRRSKTLM